MKNLKILVIGAGIGGLTAAIALRGRGFQVDVIERDPKWTVYGVGIIQQANVIRCMAALNLIDDYIEHGFGSDEVDVFLPNDVRVARISSPKLVEGYPAVVGITRRALQKVLGDRAKEAGAQIRLGLTVEHFENGADSVDVEFSDGDTGNYDIVVGADGLYSETRSTLFPNSPRPTFSGQSGWRYNLPRPADLSRISVWEGRNGVGFVPLSEDLMYMYITSPEPGNPRFPKAGLAAAMRERLNGSSDRVRELGKAIVNDDEVVYRPFESIFVDGPWHAGRVVLLGDAVHATTPHLGQGAGMAIEDAIVLAEELSAADDPAEAFAAYQTRRFERCRYIVEASLAICRSQLGTGPNVDQAEASRAMFERVAEPI